MSLTHFLLVYDCSQGRLRQQVPFADPQEAVRAYEAAEEQYRNSSDVEVVLIGADSLETIMLTHGNYFDTQPSASPYLQGV